MNPFWKAELMQFLSFGCILLLSKVTKSPKCPLEVWSPLHLPSHEVSFSRKLLLLSVGQWNSTAVNDIRVFFKKKRSFCHSLKFLNLPEIEPEVVLNFSEICWLKSVTLSLLILYARI